MRKTKIVCTIGPASEKLDVLTKLMEQGLNVARLNFSHGNHEEHQKRIQSIRKASELTDKNVAILLDTKGPEIRTGVLKEEPVDLVTDQKIILTTEPIEGDASRISVTYEGLPHDVQQGSTILVDDGLIELEVVSVEGHEVTCRVVNGGQLSSRKGVNLPGTRVQLPGITEKDAEDILFGIEQGIDMIAASFVRKADDILEIRQLLEKHNAPDVLVIAKIENREGVNNVDEILELADGLMVARGDLGVEIPAEEVPMIQKQLIHKCNVRGKTVITATQMLDSMQRNPRPTRAEASDVANAILDGTDAIMLSGETAIGKYPVEAVETMNRIALHTEKVLDYDRIVSEKRWTRQTTITDSISQAVAVTATDLDAAAIIAPTESGYTARMIAKYRPRAPIVAVTPHPGVLRKLALTWGVEGVLGTAGETMDEMMESAVRAAINGGLIHYGDLVVITGGVPVREPGTTNLMKVHVAGDIAAKGQGIGNQPVTEKVVVGHSTSELKEKMKPGRILVTTGTDRELVPLMEQASAVITEEGGLTSHAAVVGLNLGIPVIVGVKNATTIFKDDMEVTVDPEHGHIYTGHAKVL
ncbi:MAG: pyruvate kinase [Bacillaceae bacterium]|nr:pyruvate kinase [Bacillaceae bacterium]